MSSDRTDETNTGTANKRLETEDARLQDASKRTPHSADEQDAPAPERPTTPQEDNEQDIARLENPPQAEGPRERNNDAV